MTVKDLWGANFPYFGIQVIILYLFGSENCINSLRLLVALVTKNCICLEKNFQNSQVNPSVPTFL